MHCKVLNKSYNIEIFVTFKLFKYRSRTDQTESNCLNIHKMKWPEINYN